MQVTTNYQNIQKSASYKYINFSSENFGTLGQKKKKKSDKEHLLGYNTSNKVLFSKIKIPEQKLSNGKK